ncbi:uncharacterized protein LOC133198523 [Saccostrea echinata]|uniref:uncharacterized protein LOC133198523 n=1 Tax=Saccostrea echinata TaxID=191078 RepID=UPI002A83618F|nr:uncharacterized protein LOC133198523 [Saccostrea echinata]
MTNITDSFNILIIIIPSFLGLVILLTVIICVTIRLKKTKNKERITSEEPKDDVAMKAVLTNEKEEPEEYDVLRQQRQTTHNDQDLYDHAKEQSSGIYDVTIRDQSLLHDKTMTDNMYDSRMKTAIKLDNCDIDLYDDPKRTGQDTYGIPTTLHNVTQISDNRYGHMKEN